MCTEAFHHKPKIKLLYVKSMVLPSLWKIHSFTDFNQFWHSTLLMLTSGRRVLYGVHALHHNPFGLFNAHFFFKHSINKCWFDIKSEFFLKLYVMLLSEQHRSSKLAKGAKVFAKSTTTSVRSLLLQGKFFLLQTSFFVELSLVDPLHANCLFSFWEIHLWRRIILFHTIHLLHFYSLTVSYKLCSSNAIRAKLSCS